VIDVGEHFVLLETQARDVAGSQLLTRAVGVKIGGRDTLAAIDAADQKHLLIPLAVDTFDGDNTSQGVTLGPRVLRTNSGDVTYADLHCRISSLAIVFERLAEDIVKRLAVDNSTPVSTCRKVLDQWRALLKSGSQSLTRETVIGLIGELVVLRLLAVHNATGAVDSWRGPSKSVHDFVRTGAEIEVKTTTSVDGNFIVVSNIDQLDPAPITSLHLVVVHAREDSTAPSLDERIDELIFLGVPQGALLTKVATAGYVYGSGATVEDRFQIRSVRAWIVGDSFPGLRRAELGEARLKGVSKIRYELALDSAPKRLSDREFLQFMETWVGSSG
jgi:Putative  PD-(D/E)XK family member, (DUF4420)